MLPMLLAAGAGAGLGLLKSEFIDKENENKNREMQSITDRYSPWTGMRGKMVEPTNALGSAMSFGAQGAALGAGAEQMGQNKSFNDAMVKHLGGADMPEALSSGAEQAQQPAPNEEHQMIDNPTEFDVLGGGDPEVNSDKAYQRMKLAFGNRAAYKSSFPQGM